ncbi:MAG: tryptophan synthase subunit beta, partial [Ornithinimicrobium sp.]
MKTASGVAQAQPAPSAAADAVPDHPGRFGDYGGRYVPEALVAALDELDAARQAANSDPEFGAELAQLQRTYTGRPNPLTEVPRFAADAGGTRIFLKREDLNH